jgi:hypothetical protein
MGNPLYSDDVGSMCYNPAKSFQIARGGNGWYKEQSDTLVWNSGTTSGEKWSGKIIGIADYNNNPDSLPVVVKVETGSPQDLFVGFNRAAGVNSDNVEADDEVTITETGSDGIGYSQSFLKATLSEGESYVVSNWRGSGEDLTIKVHVIDLNSIPAYADVSMTFGSESTTKPSSTPTKKPSPSPTMRQTHRPTSNPTRRDRSQLCGDGVCSADENADTCSEDCSGVELETSFAYNLGSGGNMFAVKASRDVVISSLAINSNSRGDGAVRVYSRQGSFSGFEQNSAGWTLVYDNPLVSHNRRGQSTELGDFDTPVHIAGGAVQSFLVTSSRGLVYPQGKSQLAPFANDESLEIFQGIGTGDGFTEPIYSPVEFSGAVKYNAVADAPSPPTSSPTKSQPSSSSDKCGDSVCGLTEDYEICPSDCAGQELETTFEFNLGSQGNMFQVVALRDISISSLDINAMSRGYGRVKVYTREGSYTRHEQSSQGWTLVYDNPSVNHSRRGLPTELGEFDQVVEVSKGKTQAFFVMSTKGLVYKTGSSEFSPFASNDELEILEGIGTEDEFSGAIHSPRVFSGKIKYHIMSEPTFTCGDSICHVGEDSNACPADCAGKELETTYEFSLGSSGNMFTVNASRDVVISSFAINSMARGYGAVSVYTRLGGYTGREESSAGWTLIYSRKNVMHSRRGQPTELGDFDKGVFVAGGTSQSFYVTSSKGLVYSLGTNEDDVFVRDEALEILEGIGTESDFSGPIFSPRVWGGKISYDMH